MSEKTRGIDRQKCFARVLIDNTIPGQLRDITAQGFKITTIMPTLMELGSVVVAEIIDESPHQIETVKLKAVLRWTNDDPVAPSYGFEIENFNHEDFEKKYMQLLKIYSEN